MSKMNGNDHFFTFTCRLVRCCFVIVAIGPMYYTIVADPIVNKVSMDFNITRAINLVWSEKMKSMFFLDAVDDKLIKYQPDGKPNFVSTSLDVKMLLGCLVPVKSNQMKQTSNCYGNGVGVFPWDGLSTAAITAETYLAIPEDKTRGGETVGCGEADVSGRLWLGTSYAVNESWRGMLYSVDESGKFSVKLSNIGVPYAIAWSLDNKQIYYAEPAAIISTEFNKDTGELIGNGKSVFDFATQDIIAPAGPGLITVDKDGFLWVGIWQRSFVLKIDPVAKSVLTKIEFPDTYSTSSVMFVGPNVGDIYVTSSRALFHVTNTGSKAGNGVNEVVVNWPVKKPPPPPQPDLED